jgi:hypothetical protein
MNAVYWFPASTTYEWVNELTNPRTWRHDFLFAGPPERHGPRWFIGPAVMGRPRDERVAYFAWCRARGDTVVLLDVETGPKAWPNHWAPRYDGYADPDGLMQRLEEALDQGLAPVVFLIAQDIHRSKEELQRIVRLTHPRVAGYALTSEADEWLTPSRQHLLCQWVKEASDRPLGMHFTSHLRGGEDRATYWRRSPADLLLMHYGFGAGLNEIAARTRTLVRRLEPLGKRVVPAEHSIPRLDPQRWRPARSPEEAVARAEAARRNGAVGGLNG